MALERSHARSLEAGGPAADHEHAARLRGPGRRAPAGQELAPGLGVADAGDVERADPAVDAALLAGHARADLPCPLLVGLARQVRVGEQLARHRDEVGVFVGEHALGQLRGRIAADRDHRDVDGRLDLGREVLELAGADAHRGDHPAEGLVAAAGDVDVVDALLLQGQRRGHRVLQGDPAVRPLVAGHAVADGVVVAHSGADLAHGLADEAQPVLQRSAVLVGAQVAVGGEEAHEQVAVRAVQLDEVEARLPGPHRRLRVLVLQLVQALHRHLLGDLAEHALRHRRRRLGREPAGVVVRRLATGVGDLAAHAHVVGVHRVGEPAQAGDEVVVVDADLEVRAPAAARRDVRVAQVDPADAALGAASEVRDLLVGDPPVPVRHVVAHRRQDEPVLHRHPLDRTLVEQVGITGVRHLGSFRRRTSHLYAK